MFIKLTTASAAALMFAGAAFAGSPADYHAKMDANADGAVTEAEFVSYKTADGKVSAEDASAKFVKIAGDDGDLSVADLEAAMKRSHSKKEKERSDS